MNYQLGVIGGGNMAEAILAAAVRSGFLPAAEITVSDPDAARREKLSAELGVVCGQSNHVPAACPRVLLAVKPQVMAEVLEEVAAKVQPEALVISIAAGRSTVWLDRRLAGRGRIVRVMPNTPMLVGEGASAVCAGPRSGREEVDWTLRLFTCGGGLGVEVEEGQMDAVTALSGSGPAYFFYLIEAMVEAGVEEGLPPATAMALARQTCAGAARLLAETGLDPAELRRRVTSPGGTTQRALEVLQETGVKGSIRQAVRAAAARSRELGA